MLNDDKVFHAPFLPSGESPLGTGELPVLPVRV
jgi:hypothetical protein